MPCHCDISWRRVRSGIYKPPKSAWLPTKKSLVSWITKYCFTVWLLLSWLLPQSQLKRCSPVAWFLHHQASSWIWCCLVMSNLVFGPNVLFFFCLSTLHYSPGMWRIQNVVVICWKWPELSRLSGSSSYILSFCFYINFWQMPCCLHLFMMAFTVFHGISNVLETL